MIQSKWFRRGLLLALLFVALGLTLGVTQRVRASRQLAKVKVLQDDVRTAKDDTQRRERMTALSQATRQLSEAQRRELMEAGRKSREGELARYFTLSRNEQLRHLDEMINRMEQMRQQFSNGMGPPPDGGPGGQRGSMSAEEREKRRRAMLDRSTAEERERRDLFRKDMDARRVQRGLGSGRRG